MSTVLTITKGLFWENCKWSSHILHCQKSAIEMMAVISSDVYWIISNQSLATALIITTSWFIGIQISEFKNIVMTAMVRIRRQLSINAVNSTWFRIIWKKGRIELTKAAIGRQLIACLVAEIHRIILENKPREGWGSGDKAEIRLD